MQQLPGRVVHIQMEGTTLSVRFDLVPWPLSLMDITSAIEAFNAGDWPYFETQWWLHHPHLRNLSNRLVRLTAFLEGSRYYSPTCLIRLAQKRGLYIHDDEDCARRDLQRLMIMPQLCRWSSLYQGLVLDKTGHATMGWRGELWHSAIKHTVPQHIETLKKTCTQKKAASL